MPIRRGVTTKVCLFFIETQIQRYPTQCRPRNKSDDDRIKSSDSVKDRSVLVLRSLAAGEEHEMVEQT